VATWVPHIKIARPAKDGVAAIAAGLKSVKGFVRRQNKSSIVETFIVFARRRCQRYCVKATAKEPRMVKPNALARMFDAVATNAWETTLFGPSAFLSLMCWNKRKWATAIPAA